MNLALVQKGSQTTVSGCPRRPWPEVSTFLMYLFFLGHGQDLFWPQTHAVQLPDVSAAPACPHRERHSDQGGCGRVPSVAPTRKCQSSVGLRLKDGCQLTGRHLDEELPEAPGGLSQEVISPVYEHIEGASVKGIVFDREATWPVF